MSDLDLALKSIKNKTPLYTQLYSYLEGNPRLKYSTERLTRAFGNSLTYFAQSWGSIVINAVLDRLVLKGFNSTNATANNMLDDLFSRLGMNLDAQDVHEAIQVTGEAFLIVDLFDGQPEIYFNDPRLCEVFYDSDRPKLKKFAAKRWTGNDGKVYVSLYYPDRIEKYVSDTGNTSKSFTLVETVANDFGDIPVFHFRDSKRIIQGEFDKSTISLLDAVNKLFSDLMVAAEFEAFKMRVFISSSDPGDISVGPDMNLWLPANESGGQASNVIELGGSSLRNFLDPIENLASTLAVTTRTPKTYFTNSGANLSGEALLVEESPLVKKVMNKQEAYSPTWKEVALYLLKVNGLVVDANEVSCVWESPETTLPLTEAQVLQAYISAQVPLATALRWTNHDEEEINQVLSEKTIESSSQQNALAQSLLKFNGG